MLCRLSLKNFKCFDQLSLDLAPITLLCGLNGMGKSSFLQALLILKQSAVAGELSDGRLMLIGELADLGTGRDVLFEDADSDDLEFELHGTDMAAPCRLSFRYTGDADQLTATDDRSSGPLDEWLAVAPFAHLQYVSAERIGPRKIYTRSETAAHRRELGARGEYVLNYLEARQNESLPDGDPRCAASSNRRLTAVVDYWLQDVSPGAHLEFEAIRDADALVVGFSFERPGDIRTRRFRATNVGFGLSYILPVLTALLAPAGTLCLIENPEAHLHPRGQTRLPNLQFALRLRGFKSLPRPTVITSWTECGSRCAIGSYTRMARHSTTLNGTALQR